MWTITVTGLYQHWMPRQACTVVYISVCSISLSCILFLILDRLRIHLSCIPNEQSFSLLLEPILNGRTHADSHLFFHDYTWDAHLLPSFHTCYIVMDSSIEQ